MASSAAAAAAASGTAVGEGSIVHIVMFQYQEGTKEEVIRDVNTRMLALKDNCVHPTTKKPYVKMGMGGKQNSPEGLTGDIEYIFVEEFASAADRTYYLEEDPVHLAFVQSLGGGGGGGVVKKVQVVDFSPGVF
ncbi:hypothetical protein LZ554_008102 [Drepanopeziza brunnea f. sp. 'monogermtubi']|nr:hypothetical protein LZ554_008102 [Drepanopeziza brunnea f. sp. 'monogermtubi']